jgi:hypothetical protein
MPLTSCPYADYRPVLQASGMAFLDERAFSPGAWDEMGVWMGVSEQGIEDRTQLHSLHDPGMLTSCTWIYGGED